MNTCEDIRWTGSINYSICLVALFAKITDRATQMGRYLLENGWRHAVDHSYYGQNIFNIFKKSEIFKDKGKILHIIISNETNRRL